MFARISQVFLFAIFALPILAAASAISPSALVARGNCDTGSIQCCNSVQQASNPVVGLLAGLLGIVLGPITGQVGLTCTPVTVIGAGGNSCTAQPVCCTGNNFNGLIVVGCTPINLNL